MCRIPYNFSALINRSDRIPAMAGMKRAEIPMVENILPNSSGPHPLFANQKVAMVMSQLPQIKNCKKLRTVNRSLIMIEDLVFKYN
jgi:hypothetical protein